MLSCIDSELLAAHLAAWHSVSSPLSAGGGVIPLDPLSLLGFILFTKKAEGMIFPVAFYQYVFRRVGRPHWTPFPAQLCGLVLLDRTLWAEHAQHPRARLTCALVPNFSTGSGWK